MERGRRESRQYAWGGGETLRGSIIIMKRGSLLTESHSWNKEGDWKGGGGSRERDLLLGVRGGRVGNPEKKIFFFKAMKCTCMWLGGKMTKHVLN